MRHQRWVTDEHDNHTATTVMIVLNVVVRWLVLLLADHLGG